MNAQEAALKTNEALGKLPEMEYNSIMSRIKYMTSIGEFSMWENGLNKKIIEKLKSEGYEVKKRFLIGGYIISWKNINNMNAYYGTSKTN